MATLYHSSDGGSKPFKTILASLHVLPRHTSFPRTEAPD